MRRRLLGRIIFIMILSVSIGIILLINIRNMYVHARILSMIKSDPFVLDAEILLDDGILGFDLSIEIIFSDGCSMYIRNIDERGRGAMLYLARVNGFSVSYISTSGKKDIELDQNMKFWSIIIGVQLETVMDLIKNYRKINKHIENWINLNEYRIGNEKASEVRDRIIAENLFTDVSTIIFNDHEYFLFKWKSGSFK